MPCIRGTLSVLCVLTELDYLFFFFLESGGCDFGLPLSHTLTNRVCSVPGVPLVSSEHQGYALY